MKRYIKPALRVAEIETCRMLAASGDNLDLSEDVVESDAELTKGWSDWDTWTVKP